MSIQALSHYARLGGYLCRLDKMKNGLSDAPPSKMPFTPRAKRDRPMQALIDCSRHRSPELGSSTGFFLWFAFHCLTLLTAVYSRAIAMFGVVVLVLLLLAHLSRLRRFTAPEGLSYISPILVVVILLQARPWVYNGDSWFFLHPAIQLLAVYPLLVILHHKALAGGGRSKVPGTSAWTNLRSRSDKDIDFRLYVVGSGGHTTELFQMLYRSPPTGAKVYRRWVVTDGDERSVALVQEFEKWFGNSSFLSGDHDIFIIPRVRKVHQSWLTVPYSLLFTVCGVFKVLTADCPGSTCRYPDLIITNGPGTGFVIALVAWLMKICLLIQPHKCRIIFIESFARVRTLSLTGKLFYMSNIADRFVVQHRPVWQEFPKTHLESMLSTRGRSLGP